MNLTELYQTCRTFRRFEQKPVPDELVLRMLENARVANSASNAQPLRYIVVSSSEKVAQMQQLVKWAAKLPKEVGTPVEGEQPTLFIVVTLPKDAGRFANIDLGIGVHTLTTTAWESGVGSCIMGAINVPKINELLEVPEDRTAALAVAFGYPAHKSTIVDMPADGDLSYYVDDARDYYVPKRPLEEIARFV